MAFVERSNNYPKFKAFRNGLKLLNITAFKIWSSLDHHTSDVLCYDISPVAMHSRSSLYSTMTAPLALPGNWSLERALMLSTHSFNTRSGWEVIVPLVDNADPSCYCILGRLNQSRLFRLNFLCCFFRGSFKWDVKLMYDTKIWLFKISYFYTLMQSA